MLRVRPVLFLLCFLCPVLGIEAAANLTWEQARARGGRIEKVEYQLHFEFRRNQTGYLGDTRIGFELKKVPARLHLDFQGEELREVWVNGTRVEMPEIVDFRVWFERSQLVLGRNEIRVRYRNDYDTDGTGLHRILDPADGREYLFTDFEPHDANRLFPCFDQPDLKASYQVSALAPPEWKVVSNGREVHQRAEGELVRHEFTRTPRFSTYVFALCAGPFAVWSDLQAKIPSRVLALQSMAEYVDVEEIFTVTRQGFEFFPEYFGIAYPFEKYDQVFLPQFNAGAMENVALVTFSDHHLFRSEPTEDERMARANTILHEMAHMWFGDLVTMEWWNDLWLNESFATYMATLGLVKATRFTDAWEDFASGSKGWAYWQDQLPTTHPVETEVPDTLTTFTNFDGITYGKGAAVLKQLAFYVGEKAFRQGVRDYLAAFEYQNAQRKDFMDAIAHAAGVDLDGWTEKWLLNSGVNTLTPVVEVDERGKVGRFELHQGEGNGDGVLRPHRLRVAFFHREGTSLRRGKTVTVPVDGAVTRVPALEGRKAPDFVYANYGDHAFAKVYLDSRSLEFAREHLELLPAGLRAAVWSTAWFMVRDGVLAPAAFLDLFLAKAPLESSGKLLRSFRHTLPDMFARYLGEGARESFLDRLHQVAFHKVNEVDPGEDLQKVWFYFLVLSAHSSEAQTRLLDLLEGRLEIPGLVLDQERRWPLIEVLCRRGHPRAAELLEAEKQRDGSERGTKAAYRCWVAQPDPTIKAEAWKQFLATEGAPLDHLRGGMETFFQVDQRELTRPYVERFFEVLPELTRDRETYFVTSFAEKLFPGIFVEAGLLERSRSYLEEHAEAPYFLRRALLEANDELQRVLTLRGGSLPGGR